MNGATLVVDASVSVKWVLAEEGRPAAVRLLEQYRSGQSTLIAPQLVLAESGNTLWKLARRGILTGEQAAEAFEYLLDNAPILMDSPRMVRSAMALSLAHGRTLYDCLYLALALDQQCELVTADRAFYAGVHVAFPAVGLLEGA